MAKTNTYKGNKNTGKKAPMPRINAKIDNLVDNDTNLRAFASRFNAFIFLRRP